jgi:pimeloyl-ACP methyl ester carboxylesterase
MLHHELQGDGPPLLLVHAGVADLRMWAGVAKRLSSVHRVIVCDLRGFGSTPLAAGGYSDAEDLLSLLDDLGVAETAVGGASSGGAVALELAIVAPERVRSLLLMDAAIGEPFEWSDEVRAFGAAEDAALEAGDIDAAVELNVRMWLDRPGRPADAVEPDVRALVETMQREAFAAQIGVDAEPQELDPPLAERLGEVHAPALVLVGEHDVPDFRRIAERLVAELPAARPLVVVPGAAHLPALERPGAVSALALEFLAEA